MFQKGKAYFKKEVADGRIISLKVVPIFLCALLVVGNAPATQSGGEDLKVPGFWAAAKDFWNFLKASEEPEVPVITEKDTLDKDKQLVEMIGDELSSADDGAEDLGLTELSNNPICKAIYVAEYLPTFNQQAIEKCQKLIEQEEYKSLFKHYVVELCQQTPDNKLSKQQIAQIQLRLRKYSQTFPQADFQVELKDIDGIYGSKTCEHIAHYQIASQYDIINGQPDQLLYDQLSTIIPLSESEIKNILSTEQKTKKITETIKQDASLKNQNINSSVQLLSSNLL